MCPNMDGIVAHPQVKMPPIDNEKKNGNRFEKLMVVDYITVNLSGSLISL